MELSTNSLELSDHPANLDSSTGFDVQKYSQSKTPKAIIENLKTKREPLSQQSANSLIETLNKPGIRLGDFAELHNHEIIDIRSPERIKKESETRNILSVEQAKEIAMKLAA